MKSDQYDKNGSFTSESPRRAIFSIETTPEMEFAPRSDSNSISQSEKATVERDPFDTSRLFFSDSKLRIERNWFFRYVLKALLIICIGVMIALPIYWGSYYSRYSRIGNLTAFVYNFDQPDDGIGHVGRTLVKSLPTDSLNWAIKGSESVSTDAITKTVKDEHAWIAIVISQNATSNLNSALKRADRSYQKNHLVDLYYEQERDLSTFSTVILPEILRAQSAFQAASNEIFEPLLSELTEEEKNEALSNASTLLTDPFFFDLINLSPISDAILMAPLQIGMMLLVLIPFLQLQFFAPVHQKFIGKLKLSSTLQYRFSLSITTYFITSLVIGLVSVAFRIDMETTFGKPGFLVFWMILFITMVALGLTTENVAMLIVPIYPPLLSLWLLFWALLNVSPAFSAVELMSSFYKYGYGLPVYNSLALLRVVVADTTKKHMGRNFGVLAAWIVTNILLHPLCVKHFESATIEP